MKMYIEPKINSILTIAVIILSGRGGELEGFKTSYLKNFLQYQLEKEEDIK
jgi:hypothetical protein